jgi:RNAse (barnase) inhibitor barstar
MANLFISTKDELKVDAAVIEIDSRTCTTLKDFYETLAKKMYFPDYFGFNMDSLDEILSDLSWIEDERLALYFTHTEHFLINERNDDKVLSILDMIDAICEDWKWMEDDGDENDEDYIPKKSLVVGFENSFRIDEILNNMTK